MIEFHPDYPKFIGEHIVELRLRLRAEAKRELAAGGVPDDIAAEYIRRLSVEYLQKNVRMIRIGKLSGDLDERGWPMFIGSVAADAYEMCGLSGSCGEYVKRARSEIEQTDMWAEHIKAVPDAIAEWRRARTATAASLAKPMLPVEPDVKRLWQEYGDREYDRTGEPVTQEKFLRRIRNTRGKQYEVSNRKELGRILSGDVKSGALFKAVMRELRGKTDNGRRS